MAENLRDIFICHASEDKDEIVRPLVEALTQAGVSCWLDEAEIQWGDSITQKVNEGLARSRYVVVVLSKASAEKNWPQKELNAALSKEAASGDVKVLPLLVGTEDETRAILAKFPILNDKLFLPWNGDLEAIVNALLKRLGNAQQQDSRRTESLVRPGLGMRIPLPKIRKQFSQHDKDMFLRKAFEIVKRYFQDALNELEGHYSEVKTDYLDIHALKFICTIYVQGEVAGRCKIWVGGFGAADSIAYAGGDTSIDSDNSFGDLLRVADDEQRIGFSASNMWFGGDQYAEGHLLSPEEAANYLWRRFTDAVGK